MLDNSLSRLAAPLALLVLLSTGCSKLAELHPLPRRLYVCDDGTPNTVSVYSVATDGTLAAIAGSPFATGGTGGGYGGQSNCIRIHAASRRLYASNKSSVSVFSIDGTTGALTLLPDSPAAAGAVTNAFSVEISPDGNTVFVPDGANSRVFVAHVSATGALTEVAGSPFATSGGGYVADIAPRGGALYLQPQSTVIDAFSVDAGGALALLPGSPYATGGSGWTIRINPAGTQVAVGVSGVSVYSLAAGTGVPTLVSGSPFAGPSLVGSLAWSHDGAFVYAGDWSTASIHGWSVDAVGTLTPVAGSPWSAAAGSSSSLALSTDGRLLFATGNGGGTSVFARNATGALTEIAGSPFASSAGASFSIFTP